MKESFEEHNPEKANYLQVIAKLINVIIILLIVIVILIVICIRGSHPMNRDNTKEVVPISPKKLELK